MLTHDFLQGQSPDLLLRYAIFCIRAAELKLQEPSLKLAISHYQSAIESIKIIAKHRHLQQDEHGLHVYCTEQLYQIQGVRSVMQSFYVDGIAGGQRNASYAALFVEKFYELRQSEANDYLQVKQAYEILLYATQGLESRLNSFALSLFSGFMSWDGLLGMIKTYDQSPSAEKEKILPKLMLLLEFIQRNVKSHAFPASSLKFTLRNEPFQAEFNQCVKALQCGDNLAITSSVTVAPYLETDPNLEAAPVTTQKQHWRHSFIGTLSGKQPNTTPVTPPSSHHPARPAS